MQLSRRYSLRGKFLRFLLLTILFILRSTSAGAVQAHGGDEGLVSHQIGHLLFFSGMAYLLVKIYLMKQRKKGWLEFKFFLWLIIAWNMITFTGHLLNEYVDPSKFIRNSEGQIESFLVRDFTDIVFYLTRLDHLLLIPAFIFLFLALKKWSTGG